MNQNAELALLLARIQAVQANITLYALMNEHSRSEDWLIEFGLKPLLEQLKAFRGDSDTASRTSR